MAAVSSECKKLTRDLIESIAGFAPGEENYDRCYQFCMSNFKYHHYLTVDSNRVKRQLSNLSMKFRVHSYPERASQLDSLTTKFLSLSLTKSFSESDTHYSILLFLLSVSHSPTNTDYTLPHKSDLPLVPYKEDDFDWGRYLMEGVVFPSFDDSSSDSDSEFVVSNHSDSEDVPVNEISHDSAIECSDTDELEVVDKSSQHIARPYWLPYDCSTKVSVAITENQAVRETLWVLLGAQSSFLYSIKGGMVAIRSNATVFHLTQSSLDNCLNEFATLSTQLLKLRQVVMVTQTTVDIEPTLQSYSNALMCYISTIDDRLRQIEDIVSKKKKFVSLLELSNQLNDISIEVSCIAAGIGDFANSKELLDKLWLLLQTYDTMGVAGMGVVKVLFPLFIMTIRPYIGTLDKWMTSGILHDPLKEFFIQYNTESVVGDSKYWNNCYHCSNVPICFRDIANQVLIAGKSCHISVLLRGATLKSSSFYTRLLSYFLPPGDDEGLVAMETVETTPNDERLHVLLSADPVLCKAVTSLTLQPALITDNSVQFYSSLKEVAPLVSTANEISQSVTKCISTALKTILTDQFNQSSKVLTDLLKTEHNLLQHFNNVQDVLLMASGYCVHHFTSTLFHHIQTSNITDSSFLINALHEALQERHNHLLKFLSVDISNPVTIALESFTNITINYQVPWPVNVLFPEEILAVYNSVFRFLLQLKYSRWSLDKIWLIIRSNKVNTSLLHKVSLLRAKLLHFVVSVSHYLLTRILHSSGLEFHEQIQSCHDLDTLLSLHHQYISTVYDRCLLNKKAQYVKEAIMKILLLVVKFYHKCLNPDIFSYNDGVTIEEDFSKCSHFLISCLNTHIKRGSFPHLETLSFSLSSLLSGTKIFTTNEY